MGTSRRILQGIRDKKKGRGPRNAITNQGLAALLSEIYPFAIPDKTCMIPYMVCLAGREFRCHSYRQHVSYLQTHQGTLRMYGLKTVPSKSCLHNAATTIADYGWLHEIMEWQAGFHARGPLLGDPTGVAINQYADWKDAKRELISRHEFVKLHVVVYAKGRKIVSCAVTRGRAHDSLVFREMFGNVPNSTGCVMLDAGYDATKNHEVIRYSGRRPVICTRKNHVARGFGPGPGGKDDQVAGEEPRRV